MNKIDHAEKLLQLTEEGTSPFHVTASVERQFQEAGFKKVQLGKNTFISWIWRRNQMYSQDDIHIIFRRDWI